MQLACWLDFFYVLRINVCVSAGDVYVAADSGRDTSGVSGLVLRSMDTLQGYKVLGHNKQEKALAVGTCLTAIGEVVNTNPAVYFWPFASCSYICILCTLRSLLTHPHWQNAYAGSYHSASASPGCLGSIDRENEFLINIYASDDLT